MSPEKPRLSARTPGVDDEEERAWIGFYRRVGRDPAIAAEVLSQLDADPELKRRRLALYLCCKQSLRQHKAKQARDRRVGLAVRAVVRALVVLPSQMLALGLRRGRDLAVACLPDGRVEPALAQVRRLDKDRQFEVARHVFANDLVQGAAVPPAQVAIKPAKSSSAG